MQNKLLPCPFCGGEAETRKGLHELDNWVHCLVCRSKSGSFTTEETAIKRWNTRKPMERIVEQLEKMKAYAFYDEVGVLDDAIEIVKGGVDNG